MIRFGWILRGISVLGVLLALAGVSFLTGLAAQQKQTPAEQYMAPRFPSYLKEAHTVAELMPQAKALVQNRSALQGFGLGVVKKGETIALVHSPDAEDLAIQALQKALGDRGVKAVLVPEYELVGVSKRESLALRKAMESGTAENGYLETAGWIESTFPNPDGVKQWLKGKNPDLYNQLFPPSKDLPPNLKAARAKLMGPSVGKALSAYLDKHPEISGVFWGKGGSSYLRRYMHPHEAKFLGLFLWDNQWDVMSEMSSFPADVWQLIETETLDPLGYIDKIHMTDPEGTDISADLSEDQAQKFERGAYHRGHMFIFPNQAYGRFGYSVVDYPAFQKDWLSPEPMVMPNGVIAATNGHGGFYPRMEVHFANGYVKEVKGGGIYGDAFREFLKSYPKLNGQNYPFYKHPGFFYAYEFALGTNPKGFRHPWAMFHGTGGHLTPERNRSGVFHLAPGVFVQHGPNSMEMPKEWIEYTRNNNLPIDHAFHMHNYFATYQVHLRNANRWVKLVDKGHLASLDSAEVKALASRYGDPARILAEDWVPEIPGINSPGKYDDYAANPWKSAKPIMDQSLAGTYAHLYPPAKGAAAKPAK